MYKTLFFITGKLWCHALYNKFKIHFYLIFFLKHIKQILFNSSIGLKLVYLFFIINLLINFLNVKIYYFHNSIIKFNYFILRKFVYIVMVITVEGVKDYF